MEIEEIPHGHGKSFKKGISDGLLDKKDYETTHHETHSATYKKGVKFGNILKEEIASKVKK